MKAIQVTNRTPALVDVPEPQTAGIRVSVVCSSICGSDLHLIDSGYAEGRVLGHEIAGYTDDGTAVAIEPLLSCGHCVYCEEGYIGHCSERLALIGATLDGGMAESVVVPERNLVRLPTGLDIHIASLVEPLAVAAHGLDRARVREREKILVIGAGSIGLATAAVLQARGQPYDMAARHPRQQHSAQKLGATLDIEDGYDVVIDAVGNAASIKESIKRVKPRGRVCVVGTFFEPTPVPRALCIKEIELIAAIFYKCSAPNRTFDEAGRILAANQGIADVLISHRFPLDAVTEAFQTARDRAAGAIKVCFDIS